MTVFLTIALFSVLILLTIGIIIRLLILPFSLLAGIVEMIGDIADIAGIIKPDKKDHSCSKRN